MMKEYIKPVIEVEEAEPQALLVVSPTEVNTDTTNPIGIDNGSTGDEGGAKKNLFNSNTWDEEQ